MPAALALQQETRRTQQRGIESQVSTVWHGTAEVLSPGSRVRHSAAAVQTDAHMPSRGTRKFMPADTGAAPQLPTTAP